LGGKGVKKYYGDAGKLVPVLFGLTHEQLEKLENEVKKTHSGRSNISRKAVDSYWLHQNKQKIIHPPSQLFQKHLILGLKTVSITIRRDQAAWLKSMAEISGKTVSEIGRNALEFYFGKRDQQ